MPASRRQVTLERSQNVSLPPVGELVSPSQFSRLSTIDLHPARLRQLQWQSNCLLIFKMALPLGLHGSSHRLRTSWSCMSIPPLFPVKVCVIKAERAEPSLFAGVHKPQKRPGRLARSIVGKKLSFRAKLKESRVNATRKSVEPSSVFWPHEVLHDQVLFEFLSFDNTLQPWQLDPILTARNQPSKSRRESADWIPEQFRLNRWRHASQFFRQRHKSGNQLFQRLLRASSM